MVSLMSGQSCFLNVHDMLAERIDSVRHRNPISEDEIVSMTEFVLETRAYCKQSHPNWSYPISSPSFSFIKSADDLSGVVRTRSWMRAADIPPQALFYCIYNSEARLKFDKYFVRFEVSRVVNPLLDVLISEIRAPVGVTNREFVEWRRVLIPDVSGDEERQNGARYAIQLRSCDDSECSEVILPSSKHVERAEVWLSGYVFKWWVDDDGKVKGSEVLVMSQVDWRGSIPKFIMNTATVDGPGKWSHSLIDAAAQVCREKQADVSMSDKVLEEIFGIPR